MSNDGILEFNGILIRVFYAVKTSCVAYVPVRVWPKQFCLSCEYSVTSDSDSFSRV